MYLMCFQRLENICYKVKFIYLHLRNLWSDIWNIKFQPHHMAFRDGLFDLKFALTKVYNQMGTDDVRHIFWALWFVLYMLYTNDATVFSWIFHITFLAPPPHKKEVNIYPNFSEPFRLPNPSLMTWLHLCLIFRSMIYCRYFIILVDHYLDR